MGNISKGLFNQINCNLVKPDFQLFSVTWRRLFRVLSPPVFSRALSQTAEGTRPFALGEFWSCARQGSGRPQSHLGCDINKNETVIRGMSAGSRESTLHQTAAPLLSPPRVHSRPVLLGTPPGTAQHEGHQTVKSMSKLQRVHT